jgi:hypothetical protein
LFLVCFYFIFFITILLIFKCILQDSFHLPSVFNPKFSTGFWPKPRKLLPLPLKVVCCSCRRNVLEEYKPPVWAKLLSRVFNWTPAGFCCFFFHFWLLSMSRVPSFSLFFVTTYMLNEKEHSHLTDFLFIGKFLLFFLICFSLFWRGLQDQGKKEKWTFSKMHYLDCF